MTREKASCLRCKKKVIRKDFTNISIRGVDFRIPRRGYCCACERQMIFADIADLTKRGYLRVAKGELAINWKKCLHAYHIRGEHNDDWERILHLLLFAGILSYRAGGNFQVLCETGDFRFRLGLCPVFFCKRERVEAFIVQLGVYLKCRCRYMRISGLINW